MHERYDAFVKDINWHLGNFSRAENRLHEAIHHCLSGEGKRIRPVMTLAFCEACGGKWSDAMQFACAVEMVHTYSLIHDDLPCMDNDDFRRGRPTCHKVYGEAIALLAGDALLTEAFQMMLNPLPKNPQKGVEAALILSQFAGGYGMVQGQALELEGEQDLMRIHSLKTGCLFVAAAHLGCLAGNANEKQSKAARAYAEAVSLAFQIQDDILDGDGFVSVLGVEACKQKVSELTAQAKASLEVFEHPEFLLWLADFLAERER